MTDEQMICVRDAYNSLGVTVTQSRQNFIPDAADGRLAIKAGIVR